MSSLPIPFLSETDNTTPFPPVHNALENPNGLLMAGANLQPARLLDAYRQGIFPVSYTHLTLPTICSV